MELCDKNCDFLLLNEWEFIGYCLKYKIELTSTGFDAKKCSYCLFEQGENNEFGRRRKI